MTSDSLPVRLASLVVTAAFAVFAVGCGSDATPQSSEPQPSTRSSTPLTTESITSVATPDSVDGVLESWAGEGPGGVAVALAGDDDELTLAAAGSAGPDGGTVGADSAFRVGSLSKTFVAVMLLQLVAEGTIELDDLVVEHAPDLTIAVDVTIRQLLAHRSGIPEYTDSELAPAVLSDRSRTWTPADVLALVSEQPRDFAPDAQFAYSNTNYIVAGLLLETVTAMSLADNLRSRIVEPLGLTSTYFAPDEERSPIGGFSPSLPGGDTNGASYHALETAAGAAGALVSNASDLATFIRALAHGQLVPEATYAEMVSGLPDNGHTLGVFASDPASTTGISNGGAIPGFSSYMQYDPTTEDLFVLLLNDDSRSPEELGNDLLQIVRDT